MVEYAGRLENSTDTAPRVRMFDALSLACAGSDQLGTRAGVRAGSGAVVSTVPGTMSVQVTAFIGWVDGSATATQGGYPFVLDATKTLVVTDGHASLSRTDTLVARVRDHAFDGSGSTSATVEVVTGVPGAGAPAVPGGSVPLRDIVVPAGLSAGTGGLTAANLGADRRAWVVGAGGVLPISGATELAALTPYAGLAVYRKDTGRVQVYNGTAWDTYAPDKDTGWVNLTVTGATGTLKYRVRNGVVTVDGNLSLTSSLADGATLTLVTSGNAIPAAYRAADSLWLNAARLPSGIRLGQVLRSSDGTVVLLNVSNAAATSAQIHFSYLVE